MTTTQRKAARATHFLHRVTIETLRKVEVAIEARGRISNPAAKLTATETRAAADQPAEEARVAEAIIRAAETQTPKMLLKLQRRRTPKPKPRHLEEAPKRPLQVCSASKNQPHPNMETRDLSLILCSKRIRKRYLLFLSSTTALLESCWMRTMVCQSQRAPPKTWITWQRGLLLSNLLSQTTTSLTTSENATTSCLF